MYFFSFLEIKFQNGAHVKKGLFLIYFLIFSHQGKTQKNPSAYTYFAHPIDFFCLTNFAQITNLLCMVSRVTPGVDSFSRHFGAINK